MNVAEMVKNVKAECHPITNIDSIIKRWLNRGQKVIISKGSEGGWFWLRQYGYTLTTVASQMDYSLSHLVDTSKIVTFYDTAVPQYIRPDSEQYFRQRVPGPTSTGNPFMYTVKGFSPVQNQPTSASVLTLVSSSASDTAVDVRVQGLDGSDNLVSETVTMTGTSSLSTSNSFSKVLSLSKDDFSVGYFTITSNSGAVSNVVIPASNRFMNHPVVSLFDIPDSADALTYDFTLLVPDIDNDDDTSMIPEKYHDVIELYAKEQCYKSLNNPQMAQLTAQEFQQRIAEMLLEDTQPQGVMTFDNFELRTGLVEPRLPSNFPRGS